MASTLQVDGAITTDGAFAVANIISSAGSNTSTNILSSMDAVGVKLRNTSDTDGAFAPIDFTNSANALVARIGAEFQDAGDKSTDLFFATRANGGVLTEQLRIDSAGAITAGGDITRGGSVYKDGSITDTGDFTLDVAGDIILDADGGDVFIKDGGAGRGSISGGALASFVIKSVENNAALTIKGVDNNAEITALSFDMADAGTATFNNSLLIPNYIYHTGDTDTYFGFPSANTIKFVTGNVESFVVSATDVVVNDGSNDIDFRVESNANTHAFWVNANAENIGFGNTVNITENGMYMHIDANNAHMVIANLDDDDDVPLLKLNRQTADGRLIYFLQANSLEGSVSVSGSTVSYNGFAGRHESSGIPTNTAVGTVLSTIDELDTYPATTQNEALEAITHPKAGQARADHAKVKVSDSVGDKRVYGVVNEFDSDGKVYVTSVGISPVKVTGACAGGDLIESNGDGTAKVQSDDIIRSKTIGKVTIGNSSSSVKLVSCVLYCG
jgi:hypothetical protein